MKRRAIKGIILIIFFNLNVLFIFLSTDAQSDLLSINNYNSVLYNSSINVTQPTDLVLSEGDPTNNTLSWNLTDEGPFAYLGAYSFTNDTIGADPLGWIITEGLLTETSIVYENDGHHMVAKLTDNNPSNTTSMTNSFMDNQTEATIEFYWRTSSGTSSNYFRLSDNDTWIIYFVNFASEFRYWDGSYHTICSSINNQWYHIKLDWNSTGWQVEINGTLYGSAYSYFFANPMLDGLDAFKVYTHSNTFGYDIYIDAVDYSWASGYYPYRIKNYKDYLCAIFENGTLKTSWMQWSDQIEVEYNVSAVRLGLGFHNVSLVYNDVDGLWNHDDVMVTVKEWELPNILEIIQDPADPTYQDDVNVTVHVTDNTQVQAIFIETDPRTGDYLGLYSFANETIGAEPSNWNVYNDSNCSANIIAEIDGHSKVLKLHDENPVGIVYMNNIFSNNYTEGTIEFYWRTSSESSSNIFQIWDEGPVIHFRNFEGEFDYWNGTMYIPVCGSISNRWYHIKIDWNSSGWQVEINGTLYGAGYSYVFWAWMNNGMDAFEIYTAPSGSSFDTYIDAIDYSWAPGYYPNRNKDQLGVSNHSMTLISGTSTDGFWNFTFSDYPFNKNITYRVFAMDLFGNTNSTSQYSFGVFDMFVPNIVNITQTPATLTIVESVNITAHVTDNLEILEVLVESNHTGSWGTYSMNLISGTPQNGTWNFSFANYPINNSIWYRIIAIDVAGQINTTDYYNFGIFPIISWSVILGYYNNFYIGVGNNQQCALNFTLENRGNTILLNLNFTIISLPANWNAEQYSQVVTNLVPGANVELLFQITGYNVDENVQYPIIIYFEATIYETGQQCFDNITLLVTGVKTGGFKIWPITIILGVAAVATIIIIQRRKQSYTDLKLKGKTKKVDEWKFSSILPQSITVISTDLMNRINQIKRLTEEERELLIQHVALLDEEEAKKWIKVAKNLYLD
ncbi:MAG: hypothetical protein HWN66_15570 [Candidatus Helarchaeota archaeon]|nr:hypothetical protein [Candidatus Helarchaeota archaeon]